MSNFARLILPTRAIVTEVMSYDATFSFLENGVRSVIEEALLRQGTTGSRYDNLYPARFRKPGLVGDLCSVYDDYVQDLEEDGHVFFNDTADGLAQYTTNMSIIELVAHDVEAYIENLVRTIIGTKLFEVSHRDLEWHNKDLIASVRTLSNTGRGSRNFYSVF